ncbi:MAG: hypothetical protein M1510_09085 [Nitrospirae bacterium]|nr:hypothetical protein [Nitrospirota bacterium]
MNIDKHKLKELIAGNKRILLVLVIGALIAYGLFFSNGNRETKAPEEKRTDKGQLGGEEKLKAEIESLRKALNELKEKKQDDAKPSPSQSDDRLTVQPGKSQAVRELARALGIERRSSEGNGTEPSPPQSEKDESIHMHGIREYVPPRIIKIDVAAPGPNNDQVEQKTKPSNSDIQLPAGAFASFTLTSGAYAPETGEQMPVSAIIDKAFVGPNKSAVPLKGCFFLGKARGNTAEKMADIKAVKMACVWENGETFETDITGYVTGEDGRFGLKGKVNRHSGEFFSTLGITSFLEGFSAGLSRSQEAETAVATGEAVAKATNILGNAMKYGGFKGISDMAAAAKLFFASQLQGLIPSVDVAPGAKGFLYITSGITIKGGKRNSAGYQSYPYPHNLSVAQ